jgi:hypothetical protein
MPTLDLERLGLVDLSNDKEALTQTIGGGRAAGATVFYLPTVADPVGIQFPVSVLENVPTPKGIGVAIRYEGGISGYLYRQPGGSYRGNFGTGLATAPSLNFAVNNNRIAVDLGTPAPA